jgi:hypothetical protein
VGAPQLGGNPRGVCVLSALNGIPARLLLILAHAFGV